MNLCSETAAALNPSTADATGHLCRRYYPREISSKPVQHSCGRAFCVSVTDECHIIRKTEPDGARLRASRRRQNNDLTVHNIHHTVHSIQYTAFGMQYTVHRSLSTQDAIFRSQYAIQCRVYSTQYTINSIQHTVHNAEARTTARGQGPVASPGL